MRKLILILAALISTSTSTSALAETVIVSKIDKDLMYYIQRGWPDGTQSCALEEIDFLKSIGEGKSVKMTFSESSTDITFSYKDGFKRICGPYSVTEKSPGQQPIELPYH